MNAKPFTILCAPAWPSLARRLSEAGATHAGVSPAVEALLRPVRLLDMIAADAPLALGDDCLAAERVRTVLYLAAPWQGLLTDIATPDPKERGALPYQPSVLHPGALVVVALAAIRVMSPLRDAESAVRTVLGLAIGASAVEVLGRSEPGQIAGEDLGPILTSLLARGAIGEPRPAVVQVFSHDPVERGRWACLLAAFGGEAMKPDTTGPWDAAQAEAIDEIDSPDGWPGAVRVGGRFTTEKPLLDRKKLKVVLASPGQAPVAIVPSKVTAESFEMAIPPTATPGWVGFSSGKGIEESNAFREGVRVRWRDRSGSKAAEPYRELLRGAPVPVDVVPKLGPELSSPPRTGKNRFFGGRPLLLGASLERDALNAKELTLTWESVGTTAVVLSARTSSNTERLPPSGTRNLPAPRDEDEKYTLTPIAERLTDPKKMLQGTPATLVATADAPPGTNGEAMRITSVTLGQLGGNGSPPYVAGVPIAVQVFFEPATLSPVARLVVNGQRLSTAKGRGGRVELTMPGDRVTAGNPFTFSVDLGEEGPRLDLGPYEVRGARDLRAVVLVRPAVLRDGKPVSVNATTARGAVIRACKSMNVQLDPEMIRELPWVDDPLAVLSNDVQSAEDPRVVSLLEHLSRAAARTAGFENAVWIVLVPDERDVPVEDEPDPGGEGGDDVPDPGGESGNGFAKRNSSVRSRQGFESHSTAEAALAVCVANRDGLELFFSRLFPLEGTTPSGRPAATRLRLVGTIGRGGEISLDPSREEFRSAGAGANVYSGVLAVTYDADGRELQRVPVKTLRDFPPARFALLLPVSPEVKAVELRVDEQVMSRIQRASGSPRIAITESKPEGLFEWTYQHPSSAAPSFEVEIVAGDLATPAFVLYSCARSLELPLHRFYTEEVQVRLVATDGWNTDSSMVSFRVSGGALIARRVNSTDWWADTNLVGTLAWSLDGREIARGRLVALDSVLGAGGMVLGGSSVRTLTVTDEDGARHLVDLRYLGGSDA